MKKPALRLSPRNRLPGLLLALSAAAALTAAADTRRLATMSRHGDQYDGYIARGDAAVAPSPVLNHGVRLAAWDDSDTIDGSPEQRMALAAAVYYFAVPEHSDIFEIEIAYEPGPDLPEDATVAGHAFIRNLAVEEEYGPGPGADTAMGDGPAFYGDTYLLPAAAVRNVIDVAAVDRMLDGVLELHVAAGAGQVLDVERVHVTALAAGPSYRAEERALIELLPDPYRYSYGYYYVGPWRLCRPGLTIRFSLPGFGIGIHAGPLPWIGWRPYRRLYRSRHVRICRPSHEWHGTRPQARPLRTRVYGLAPRRHLEPHGNRRDTRYGANDRNRARIVRAPGKDRIRPAGAARRRTRDTSVRSAPRSGPAHGVRADTSPRRERPVQPDRNPTRSARRPRVRPTQSRLGRRGIQGDRGIRGDRGGRGIAGLTGSPRSGVQVRPGVRGMAFRKTTGARSSRSFTGADSPARRPESGRRAGRGPGSSRRH